MFGPVRILILLAAIAGFDGLRMVSATATDRRAADDQYVRVQIYSGSRTSRFTFQAEGVGGLRIEEGARVLATLAAGEPIHVEEWEGLLRVRWAQGSAPISRVRLSGSDLTRVSTDGGSERTYRGTFDVEMTDRGRGIRVVNTVDVESYVASVLPSEYPFTEIEGAMAQAVVIRSYALSVSLRPGRASVLRDDTGSQVYRGAGRETDFSRRVASATAGSVLLHDGNVVEAVYSANCGGHTANNEDIWGTAPLPYLRARKDPYDGNAPNSRWSESIDSDDLLDGLSTRFQNQVRDFKITDRGAGDHVKTIQIRFRDGSEETTSGERFRSIVNAVAGRSVINSSLFKIEKKSGRYEFEGRGSGHGVGFCQWGAAEQAKRGRDYEDILRFYYKDVEVVEPTPEVWAGRVETESGPAANETEIERAEAPRRAATKKKRTRRPGW